MFIELYLRQRSELLTMWFGESEANVREIFDKARSSDPCEVDEKYAKLPAGSSSPGFMTSPDFPILYSRFE